MSVKHRIIQLLLGLSALGCFPGKVVDTGDVTTREDSTSDDSTSEDPTTETTPSETSTGDGDGDLGTEEETWGGFVPDDDSAVCGVCDTFAQDCPEGEKCVPGPDRGGSCGPPRCLPVVADGLPGEACSVVDGIDDCDASSWCYPTLLEFDGPASCIEHCGGTIDNPACSNPDEVCVSDHDIYYGALRMADIPNLRRVRHYEFAFRPGVEVTEIRQVKGLEYDYVILVDVNDSVLGTEEKLRAHESGVLHRAFSVFLIDAGNRVLLQQRAIAKYHSPGLWSNSCCGHPLPGEDTRTASARRLVE